MYCSHCGTHLANSSVFCYNCGQKVDVGSCPSEPPYKVKPLVDLDRDAHSAPNAKGLMDRLRNRGGAKDKRTSAEDAESAERPAGSSSRIEGSRRKPLNKRSLIVGGRAAVLLIACLIGAGWANSAFFGPRAFVEEYFQAIADGDCAKARSMSEDSSASEAVIGVMDGTLDEPRCRISNVLVGEMGASGEVSVSYNIGDASYSSEVIVKDCTPHLPLFKRYAISDSAEVAVPISNCGPCRMLLNGVEFGLSPLPNDVYPVRLMCLPGRYTLSSPVSDIYSCDEIELVVSSSVEASIPISEDGLLLELDFSDSLLGSAESSVASCIEGFIRQGGEAPKGAPFKAHLTANSDFKNWIGVESMPGVRVLEAADRKSASIRMIKGSSVLYATTSSGSVGYEYTCTLPSSKLYEKRDSARIRAMDIYVDLQSGALSVVHDGKVIYGEPLGGDLGEEAVVEDLLSDFGLLDELQALQDR